MVGPELVVAGWFAAALIGKFVNKAGDYLSDNYDQHRETKVLLQNLEITLLEMQPILRKAEKKEVHDKELNKWIELIKDAAYEAEDMLDNFDAKIIREGLKGKTSKVSMSILKDAKKFVLPDNDVVELKVLVNKLQVLCEKSRTFLQSVPDNKEKGLASTESKEPTPILLHDQPLFGRDNDVKFILTLILGYEIESLECETISEGDEDLVGPSNESDIGNSFRKIGQTEGNVSLASSQESVKGKEVSSSLERGTVEGPESREISDRGKTSSIGSGLTLGAKIVEPSYKQDEAQTQRTKHYGRPFVIPIVGISGVGKTALAKTIFSHQLLSGHFVIEKFIYLSGECDINQIKRELVPSFDPKRPNDLEISKLRGKRILLVLDGVSSNMLLDLKFFVHDELSLVGYGSVILVTTQKKDVANKLGTIGPINLDPLEWNYFLQLLEYYAFKHASITNDERETLKKICKDIGKKLPLIPLVAITVGRLLNSDINKEHWEIISKISWTNRTDDKSIIAILRNCYNDLEENLKLCFAFCSIFPTNYVIERDRIIQMWIANGFIQKNGPSDNSRLEDIGRLLFYKLVNRSFFLSTPWPHKYIMHNTIRELARSIFPNETYLFDGNPNPCPHGCFLKDEHSDPCSHGYAVYERPKDIPNTTRYLTMIRNNLEYEMGMPWYSNLRTLLFYDDYFVSPDEIQTSLLHVTTKLRVLALSYRGEDMKKQINEIVEMKHLRFLDLSYTAIKNLPESICSLCHLEVLDLRGCKIQKVPTNMNHLNNLRHLYASKETISLIYGIGKLTNLQELEEFKITEKQGHTISELSKMNEIGGHLSIVGLENVEDEAEATKARLAEKKYLKVLSLRWDVKNSRNKNPVDEVGGHLSIAGPENVKDEAEAREAKLMEKKYLKVQSQRWAWNYPWAWTKKIYSRNKFKISEPKTELNNSKISEPKTELPSDNMTTANKILTSLQPHLDVEKLEIVNYMGTELPSWTTLTQSRIRHIFLKSCHHLKNLPPLGKLPILETLVLEDLNLENIGEELCVHSQPNFPKLKVLKFVNMRNLKIWSSAEETELLPCLEELEIRDCYSLNATPLRSLKLSCLKKLELSNCKGVLKEGSICDKKLPVLTSLRISNISPITLYYHNLPNLKELSLTWSDVDFKGDQKSLTNLKSLILDHCHVCWNGIPDLPSLTEFKVKGSFNDIREIENSSLPSLKVLEMGNAKCPMNHLPLEKWLQKLQLLELTLTLEYNKELPSILHDLISLETLTISLIIYSRDDLLPMRLRSMPPSLKQLFIKGSLPELWLRCKPEQGEDWHKISHVPYIRINDDTLQML
jgi:Leucine-rich repeat (LRR) protein